jgi:hypothetical protein
MIFKVYGNPERRNARHDEHRRANVHNKWVERHVEETRDAEKNEAERIRKMEERRRKRREQEIEYNKQFLPNGETRFGAPGFLGKSSKSVEVESASKDSGAESINNLNLQVGPLGEVPDALTSSTALALRRLQEGVKKKKNVQPEDGELNPMSFQFQRHPVEFSSTVVSSTVPSTAVPSTVPSTVPSPTNYNTMMREALQGNLFGKPKTIDALLASTDELLKNSKSVSVQELGEWRKHAYHGLLDLKEREFKLVELGKREQKIKEVEMKLKNKEVTIKHKEEATKKYEESVKKRAQEYADEARKRVEEAREKEKANDQYDRDVKDRALK